MIVEGWQEVNGGGDDFPKFIFIYIFFVLLSFWLAHLQLLIYKTTYVKPFHMLPGCYFLEKNILPVYSEKKVLLKEFR